MKAETNSFLVKTNHGKVNVSFMLKLKFE